jgi:hypothetical protein
MLDIALEVAQDKWVPMLEHISWVQYGFAVAYLLCAWMCIVSGSGAYQAGEKAGGWFLTSFVLLMMAIESVLQLNHLMVLLMRGYARAEGWYGERRYWQAIVVGCVIVLSLAIVLWLRKRQQEEWHLQGNVVIGMSVLVVLQLMHYISLHHVDALLNFHLGAGIRAERVIESVGLLLVFIGTRQWLTTR